MSGKIGSITTDIIRNGLVFNMDPANRASYIPNATTSFNTIDLSQSGTLENGVAFIQPPISSSCWDFDGSDDFISGGDILNFERTDSFTVSAWVKRNSINNDQATVSKMTSSAHYRGYLLAITSANVVTFILRNTTSATRFFTVSSTTTITDLNWHNIVATYDGSSASGGVKIYIDGVSDTVSASGTLTTGTTIDSAPFNIGARNSNNLFADVNIGPVHIYNRALSSTEVLHNYNALKDRFNL